MVNLFAVPVRIPLVQSGISNTDMFGYIKAICPKCGFVGTYPPTWEYDYDEEKWRRSSESET